MDFEIIRNTAAGYDTTSGFTTGATSAGYINPEVWSQAILEAERQSLVVAPLGAQNTELLNKPGDIVHLTVGKELSASAVAESDKLGVAAIEYLQYNITPSEYGVAIQVTAKQVVRSFVDVMMDKAKEMGIGLATLKDTNIISALSSSATTSILANSKTATSDLASSDTLDVNDIVSGRTAMRKLRVTPQYLVISADVEGDLLKLSQFIDVSQYGGREAILNGEIGKIMGMKVLMSNNISAASNVVESYLLGAEAFTIAQKTNPNYKEDYDVLGRFFTLASFEDYGWVVQRPDRVAKISSYAA